ncbi:MAG: hypothetical protein ABID83_04300 [Candidatus Omnitrophota bacterium]
MDKKKLFEYCFGCSPALFPETAIITPFLHVGRFAEHCQTLESFKGRLYSGITAVKDGQKFAVVHCRMGDRFMGDAVLLLNVSPVSKMLFAGACGGLTDCGIGDLVICESAFNGEGFSRYYGRDFDMKRIFDMGELNSADAGYTESLTKFLSRWMPDKTALKTGDIFTTGSLVAEQRANVLEIEKKGFMGIDMELSAVYCAARVAGLKAAGLVFVSDLPLKKPLWETLAPPEKNGYDMGAGELVRLSVEFVSKEVQ